MKKHPIFKEISKKYKPVKPKTEADKEQNKKNKAILEREKESFKRYLLDVNEFLVITYLILFHLQVSSPPYDVKTKDILMQTYKKYHNYVDPYVLFLVIWSDDFEVNQTRKNKSSTWTKTVTFVHENGNQSKENEHT